jgi:hypothetical protein
MFSATVNGQPEFSISTLSLRKTIRLLPAHVYFAGISGAGVI